MFSSLNVDTFWITVNDFSNSNDINIDLILELLSLIVFKKMSLDDLFKLLENSTGFENFFSNCIEKLIDCIENNSIDYSIMKDEFLTIIEALDKKIDKKTYQRAFDLFLSGLISYDCLLYVIDRIEEFFDIKTKCHLKFLILIMNNCANITRSSFYSSLYVQFSVKDTLSSVFDLDRLRSYSHGLQFIAASSILLFKKDCIISLIKCLGLYGAQHLSASTAIQWISYIDSYLGKVFNELCSECDPFVLHPKQLLISIATHFHSNCVMCVFGDFFLYLRYGEGLVNTSFSKQMANNEKNHKAAIEILEMQSYSYFSVIKSGGKSIQSSTNIVFDPSVANSLFGNSNQLDVSNKNRIIIKESKRIGKNAFNQLQSFLKSKILCVSPHSSDCRDIFFKTMKKEFALMDIVFNGFCMNINNNSLKKYGSFLQEIMNTNQKILSSFDFLINTFSKNSHIIVSEPHALSLYYFLKLFEAYADCPNQRYELLHGKFFGENPPYTGFSDFFYTNFDVPMKHLIKNLNKIEPNVENMFTPGKIFLFTLNISLDNIELTGSINPFV